MNTIYRQNLNTEIEYLKGIGPLRADILKKELNIFTFGDLLNYFPFRYVDKSKLYKIRDIASDATYIQLKGVVRNLYEAGKGRGKRLVAEFSDDTGSIELVWFKGHKWIRQSVREGEAYIVYGRPSRFKNEYNIAHPEMELVRVWEEKKESSKFQPVYSTTEKLTSKGLDSKGISKLQLELQKKVGDQVREILPDSLIAAFKLMPRDQAYRYIHFPPDPETMEKARLRLKFEELFLVQLELLQIKLRRDQVRRSYVFGKVGDLFNRFYKEILPFDLTGAQKKVMKEIRADLKSGKQMNRLLQGDVGSGKTIVALMTMLLALDNNTQACLMAPTEILANQHFENISKLTRPLGIEVALLTGSTKQSVRNEIDLKLRNNEIQLLIGTHALIEDKVHFHQLGQVIIDEQHRFGVAQRAKLWKKSKIPPHVLVMTATPIPRTLAMTFYGDLDTSVIDELPPGRKAIMTRHFFESSRLKLFGFLKKMIKEGRQVYIVYPLIEESSKLDYKNLMAGYDIIDREFPKPEYQIGIVHGKMKSVEKDREMQRFKNGELDILVSTTVIEVGVDVPNATVMVIESAERFGLSQLHQLRGRVGRGAHQSYCVLMTADKLTNDAKTRMETMVATNDGFRIAEVDLNLRGPGDIAGTQQSGLMNFKLANLVSDHKILKSARYAVQKILEEDPGLKDAENNRLRQYLEQNTREKFYWSEIS